MFLFSMLLVQNQSSRLSEPRRFSKAALAVFVLGASSLVLLLVTALPAFFLGIWAIRTINRSEGRLRGQGLVLAGLALSALTTAATILGLIGMVLLYVQEKNHVASCANNLRQIGAAIYQYSDHDDHHYFPPGTVRNPALKPSQRLSWEAAILPFFPEGGTAGRNTSKQWEKLVGAIAFQEAWNAPANAGLRRTVTSFLCPTFAHEFTQGQVGLTSYVGIAGVGEDAAILLHGDANAGFFGYDRLLGASDISARLDATMTAIETMQDNGPWPAGGLPTVRGVLRDSDRCIGRDAAFGGLHRGGANVLWADGSVRFLTDKIDPTLFREEARIKR
jgi:prepilin-type processing-associated H-X9-DG protein